MTKKAFKEVINMLCQIAEFTYTIALTIVKGTCNCVQGILVRL